MDDLIKMCDKLEKCRKEKNCIANEIICSRKIVKDYVGNDKNKLLTLKAQLEIHKNSTSHDLNLLAVLIAAFSFFTTSNSNNVITVKFNTDEITVNSNIDATTIFVIGIGIIIIVMFCGCIYWSLKTNRNKWKQYIAVALEDLEKERFSN